MSAARAKIIFYYDLISPYTFMGKKLLNRYRQQWPDVDIVYKPILLGGIMNTADLDRISTLSGVPFKFPENFPVNTILPMRVLTALQKYEATEKYEQCIDKDEYFVHGRNISQPEVIQTALTPILSNSDAKVLSYMQMAGQADIKQAFKENTDEAVARGVFGAPTMIIKKAGEPEDKEHLFFGSDRFEVIAAFLGLPYPGLVPKNGAGAKL
ncbi:hypothetical protein BGX20_010247 [Mortierella sp. AD010]|nr:hypothetical protein BGX20_010247 [Mortierella sp. AD010]